MEPRRYIEACRRRLLRSIAARLCPHAARARFAPFQPWDMSLVQLEAYSVLESKKKK